MSNPEIISKLRNGTATIGVIGLGYVGLPLVLGYSRKGFHVLGFDIDEAKIQSIRKGESYIQHIESGDIAESVKSGKLEATTDFSRVSEVDALIMCVPTPLDEHYEPDLSFVVATVENILPHLKKGQAVSLESTTYPGTTDEELRVRVEERGFVTGEDIFVVYSPEREDPGNEEFLGVNIPKVVGGSTATCAEVGKELYGAAFGNVVPVSSTQVAEFTKLLENIYRSVNIGLVNELKVTADKMGIDIWEVIEAAKTKPFGFKAFYPGPGLGGHCIPIDPFYLTWKAREYGHHTRFIELAGEINRAMPDYVVQRSMESLNDRAKPVRGSRILIMGLAYKENVDDMRESPAFTLMDSFRDLGARVDYFDPHIPEITPTREHAEWTGTKSVEFSAETVKNYDCIVLTTDHACFDLSVLVEHADLIVDTRNAITKRGLTPRKGQLIKA